MLRIETRILMLTVLFLAVCDLKEAYEIDNNEDSLSEPVSDDDDDETMNETDDVTNEKDMFLGDYIKGFKNMDANQQKEKLTEFLKSEVDINSDGFISEEELRTRFRHTNRMYKRQEVKKMMEKKDENFDGKVSWEEFSKGQYEDEEDQEYKEKDEKKFRQADRNGDNKLDSDEYFTYQNPLDDRRMVQFLVDQELENYDKDNDGKISLKEFENSNIFDDLNENTRKEIKLDFDRNYDVNHDGKLDRQELVAWSVTDAEFIRDTPKNLLKEGDLNKDGKLSFDEIYKNLNSFLDAPLNMNDDKPVEVKTKAQNQKEKYTEGKRSITEL